MERILVVEDDFDIAEMLQTWLTEAGYGVEVAQDGLRALDVFAAGGFDLVLLDLMLPKLDGFGVCEWIRARSDVPVVMLTALDGEEEQLRGYDLRIDDYVTKPFAIEELLARIRVALKHGGHSAAADTDEICQGKLVVNTRNRHVAFDGQEVTLTKTEFDMLAYMAAHPDKVLSRDELLSEVWGYSYAGDTNIVDVYVRYLRQKLDERFGVKLLHTVRGVGYLFKYEQ